jgi:cytochrome c oxidase assembly factor CtaG
VLLTCLLSDADPFGTGRGWAVLVVALAVVAALGPVSRRARLAAPRRRTRPVRPPALDAARLLAAGALGAAAGLLLPLGAVTDQPSDLAGMIGYELPMHLDAVDLAVRWRPDLVFGTLAVVGAARYLWAVRRLSRRGVRWPVARTSAWLGGCAVVLVATCSGLGSYAPVAFSLAMVQHVLLMTAAPFLLVCGHGLTLRESAGPGARVPRWSGGWPARLLGSPLAAVGVGALVLFGLFATGLYAALISWHWAHPAMNLAFLAAGLMQFSAVLGLRRTRPLPPIGQLVVVFAVMALHAGFAVWLLGRPAALAPEHYIDLPVPYIPDLLADQRRGAVLGWALAEIPTVLTVVVLVLRWTAQDGRAPAGGRLLPPSTRGGTVLPHG